MVDPFLVNTGTVSVSTGLTLYFMGGGVFGGQITGSGDVLFGGSSDYSLNDGFSVAGSALDITDYAVATLTGGITDSGGFTAGTHATLDFDGATLTLTGQTNQLAARARRRPATRAPGWTMAGGSASRSAESSCTMARDAPSSRSIIPRSRKVGTLSNGRAGSNGAGRTATQGCRWQPARACWKSILREK